MLDPSRLLILLFLSSLPTSLLEGQVQVRTIPPVGLPGGFSGPHLLSLRGLPPGSGGTPISTEEPFLSRDGRFLFFNSGKEEGRKDIYFAEKVGETWVFRGALGPGLNDAKSVQATPTMDRTGRFYYLDSRSPTMVRTATFLPAKGEVRSIGDLQGIPGKKIGFLPPTFTGNMGVEVSADGRTLLLSRARWARKGTALGSILEADILFLSRGKDGRFHYDPAESRRIMAGVNTPDLEYAPSLAPGGLELFFTRMSAADLRAGKVRSRLMRSTRSSLKDPFGPPVEIEAAGSSDFVEAPTLSGDGKTLVYHKKEGKKFRLYMLSRRKGGTGKGFPAPGLFLRHLQVDGRRRRYYCYVPPGLGPSPRPLVMELHGGGVYIEDLTGQRRHKTPYKLWMRIADREKFLVLYPEGWNGPKGRPTWHDGRSNAKVYSKADDVKFLTLLAAKAASRYPVDLHRIYISGTSNGGLMALRMAVEKWDILAAVAAVGAAMPDKPSCGPPKHPVSVLFMNGTADGHMPYLGGFVSKPPNPDHGSVLSTPASVRIWRTLDRCNPVPAVVKFPDLDKRDGSTVIRYTYAGGIGGTQVVLYKVRGGGHSAPSIQEQYSRLFELFFGRQNHDIEAVEEIWKFFKDKRRP